jgi:hypothetical protein
VDDPGDGFLYEGVPSDPLRPESGASEPNRDHEFRRASPVLQRHLLRTTAPVTEENYREWRETYESAWRAGRRRN